MAETKTVRVRPEIRELAQVMELRMREADAKGGPVRSGKVRHVNFMSEADLIAGVERNLAHLKTADPVLHEAPLSPDGMLEAAADAANYLNFLRLRMAGAD